MTEIITLYRGIKVPFDQLDLIKNEIFQNGITGNREMVTNWCDLRSLKIDLFKNVLLTTNDTRKENGVITNPYIFSTGNRNTGVFYACRQDKTNAHVLITFKAKISDLLIDPKDFLASVFQNFSNDYILIEKQKSVLTKMYGKAILPYIELAKNSINLDQKLAILDIACSDLDVIRAHLQNPIKLEGRYGVPITSIFYVKAPIEPRRIKTVEVVSPIQIGFDAEIQMFV